MRQSSTRKVAVVTGAARGIGAAIAVRLAQEGMEIAVLDLDAGACSETVRAIEDAGCRALAVAADVADEAAVKAAVRAIAGKLGPPTVLVNNAGIVRDRIMHRMNIEDWDRVMNVHLRGAFLMSREVHPHMRARNWGRIVNVSSTAALGAVGQANYSSAKAGLQGFTKTLAIEMGRFNVTVNVVAPGFTVTEITKSTAEREGISFDELVGDAVKQIPVGRVGQPEDIAHAVAFFVDERSSFISGQVLYVSGGPRS
ncbi:MAG: 3-oxoacyl-ACP reductase FabG [Steroidobacteraceae bacterium]